MTTNRTTIADAIDSLNARYGYERYFAEGDVRPGVTVLVFAEDGRCERRITMTEFCDLQDVRDTKITINDVVREQIARVWQIATRTARYIYDDEEYRDAALAAALVSVYRPEMTDNELLLAAGYIETVDEQTLLAQTGPIRGGQTGEETIALVYPAGSQYQDLLGEPIPTEWHDEDELLRFVRERGVIVEVPIGR
jgi:hypothetical protein